MLITYQSDKYIESVIVLTVLMDVTLNNTSLECYISGLDNDTKIVNVNTSSECCVRLN